jgi:Domain of unknown function (DUF4177)
MEPNQSKGILWVRLQLPRGKTMDTSRPKTSWEYKVVRLGPSSSNECEDLLNQLGKDGWDLVSFQPTSTRAYPGEGTYTLKRPR